MARSLERQAQPGRSFARRKRPLTRRLVSWLLFCLALVVASMPRRGTAQKPVRLFVFATTEIRALALERELAAALPGVQVRVFGRPRELEVAVQGEAPDAVLARPVVLETLGLRPTLLGTSQGSTGEPYVLLSIGRAMKPSELGDQSLGVVDLVGRHDMKPLVSKLLGVPAPKLKLVTTEHDLLPLLQFREAEAVLLPSRWVTVLRKKSNLDLRTTALPNTLALPALWSASDSVRVLVEPLVRAWSPQLNSRLGVDAWK